MSSALAHLRGLVGRNRWAIGIYAGDGPFTLRPAAGVRNPVLTHRDVSDRFATLVADPFLIRVDGGWHMFFEVVTVRGGAWTGVVGHATSADGLAWRYRRTVLAEPFHLSYPYVFAWDSDIYMIPESQAAGAVRLYRADPFPDRWTFVRELLRGPVLCDSSVFRWDGRWWMFTETSPGTKVDTLRLFHAPELLGPWREHPRSPVVAGDRRTSRPAGRVLVDDGRLFRFAQDCAPAYGTGVRAFEVVALSPTAYEERPVASAPILGPGDRGWNVRGMHQIDAHRLDDGRWLACVDGWHTGLVEGREIAHRLAERWAPREASAAAYAAPAPARPPEAPWNAR